MVDESRPGISRTDRITDEGLQRLEKQLQLGINISTAVLKQWVRRYGDPARRLIQQYGIDTDIIDD